MNDWFHRLQARPVAVIMVWLAGMLLGSVSLLRTPINLAPDRSFPGLTIRTEYSGIGPEKMEELVTRPIEETIATVGGLRRIFSISEEGKSTIEIEIERGEDVDLKALEIRERIDIAAVHFPPDAQKPLVYRYDPDKVPIFIVALESDSLSQDELRSIADRQIKKAFQAEPGTSEVLVAGGQETEVLVSCDKEKLDGYGVSLSELLQIISRNNSDLALGRVGAGPGEYPAIAIGRLRRPRAISELAVPTRDGVFPLHQIAEVQLAPRDADSSSRLDGSERVSVYVHRASGADLLRLSANLRDALARMPASGWRYTTLYDEGQSVAAALWSWAQVTVLALLLGAAVGWATRLPPGRALWLFAGPVVAMVCAPFILFLGSIPIDMVTLSGMTVGALFSVAVAAPGGPPAAVLKRALLALTLLSGLLAPFLLLDYQVREIYAPLAATTVAVGFLACAAQLTLQPILADRLNRRPKSAERRAPFWMRGLLANMTAAARRVDQAARHWPVHPPFDWRVIALFSVPILVALTVLVSPKEVYGIFQEEELNLAVEFPSGTSFGAADAAVKKIEQKLNGAPGIVRMNSRVESARGTIRLELDTNSEVSDSYISQLRQRIGATSPATVFFSSPGQTQSLRDLTIDVYGEDLKKMEAIIRQISDAATKLSGVAEVVLHFKPPRPERALRVDREKMYAAGVSTESLGSTIRTAIQGGIASRLMGSEREYDIRIRYDEGFRRSLEALGSFGIKGADERLIAALELTRAEDRETPLRIYRNNRKRSLSFSVQLHEQGVDRTIAALQGIIAGLELPPEYRVEFSQAVQESLATRRRIGLLVLLGFLTMAAALTIGFESYRRALRGTWIAVASVLLPAALFYVSGAPLTAPVLLALFVLASIAATTVSDGSGPGPTARNRTPYFLALTAFSLPLIVAGGPGGAQLRGLGLALAPGFLTLAILWPGLLRCRAAGAARMRAAARGWWGQFQPLMFEFTGRLWRKACAFAVQILSRFAH